MSQFRLINTEGSLLNNNKKNTGFFILKKDPFNNYLWKSLKKGPSVDKNKKLYDFKQRILNIR